MPQILKDLRESFIKYLRTTEKIDKYWTHASFSFKKWNMYIQSYPFEKSYHFIITIHPKEWPPKIWDPPQIIYSISGAYTVYNSEDMYFSIYATRENSLMTSSKNIQSPEKFKKKIFDELELKLSDIKELPILLQLETVKMV